MFSRTLGKKFGPGSKLTSAVQVANTRKIGKKINIKLIKVYNLSKFFRYPSIVSSHFLTL